MVTTRSASEAISRICVRLSGVSRAIGIMRTLAPCCSSRALRPKLLEEIIWSGPGVSPGMTSSLPFETSATTGFRNTGTPAIFIEASSATSAADRRRGAGKGSPSLKSPPAGRM